MRGSQSRFATNLERLDLRSSSAVDLERVVSSELRIAGVSLSPDAEYTLYLSNENYDRAVLTVSPVTGKVEEYTMTLTVAMSVGRRSGEELLMNDVITFSRDYLFDEDALLGKASEEEVIRENLRQRAAGAIIRRLNSTVNSN